jgi:hypothetical protein
LRLSVEHPIRGICFFFGAYGQEENSPNERQIDCVGDFSDCAPAILDLRKRELFVSDALPAFTGPTVASELAWADGFFAAAAKAA